MQFALLMARLFLALVFGVAGIAKAADKAGSRRAIIDFGVPERLAPLVAWCLPLVEILVALALAASLPTAVASDRFIPSRLAGLPSGAICCWQQWPVSLLSKGKIIWV
jgi:hypothetical protein